LGNFAHYFTHDLLHKIMPEILPAEYFRLLLLLPVEGQKLKLCQAAAAAADARQ
jgi:hypothetical protein